MFCGRGQDVYFGFQFISWGKMKLNCFEVILVKISSFFLFFTLKLFLYYLNLFFNFRQFYIDQADF